MRSRSRKSSAHAIALSPRQLLGRASLVLMILASVALIVVSRTSPQLRSALSTPIADSATPALDLLSQPSDAVSRLRSWVATFTNVYAQNAQLREANARLMQWQNVATQLEAENAALRELLHYSADEKLSFTTAKVISDRSGPLSRTVLLNAGTQLGMAEGQPVINGDGLVGRVIEAGNHSSRVLLLSDINSRVPVVTTQSRERSIAAGDNSETLSLLYLADDSKITVGEKLITSGDGDTVPAGLPVGEVVSIHAGVVKVRPYANWYRLNYVSAIHREAVEEPFTATPAAAE
ncbi:MAG: rod shape-determining protein MreC [Alphaproteobacteria bacterium]|nr:rod shape-determining protein MreC [Alphaproteobacteria bacterium]